MNMTLNEGQLKIIRDKPLGDELDGFRKTLRQNKNVLSQSLAEELLKILSLSPAALHMPVPVRADPTSKQLFSLLDGLRRGLFDPLQFSQIADSVGQEDCDEVALWNAVFDVINALNASSSSLASVLSPSSTTPVKSSTGRFTNFETREILEDELLEELRHRTFRGVPGFVDRIFSSKGWSADQHRMYDALLDKAYTGKKWTKFPNTSDELTKAHTGKKWTGFPDTSDELNEALVRSWLLELESTCLKGLVNKIGSTTNAYQILKATAQMDIIYSTAESDANGIASEHAPQDFLVVGELKASDDPRNFKTNFLQLSRYVRIIFSMQPLRRFVHAFTLCGSTMEAWIFDRSGAFSSGPFDLRRQPATFARVLVSYATMQGPDLGFPDFLENVDGSTYVTLSDTCNEPLRVRLGDELFKHSAIVSRATVCYNTDCDHVIKFAWTSEARESEASLLRLTQDRHISGVARLVAHRELCFVADHRCGLEFPAPYRFRNIPSKRKASASSSSSAIASTASSKRSADNQPWEDKRLCCTMTWPMGRTLSRFTTLQELLEGLLDAIRAHRSLLVDANLLHRDISPSNIILTDASKTDGWQAMLIDLDLAKRTQSDLSGAWQLTGTVQYMAIEVLQGKAHTYRHDLESFLYVLICMCGRTAWTNGSAHEKRTVKAYQLRKWEVGTFETIAGNKLGHMTPNGLDSLMDEFPTSFAKVKHLCERLRSILFGEEARLFLGTHQDREQLYDDVIGAFQESIRQVSVPES